MQVKQWKIEDVKPYEGNSRIHDQKNINAIDASIDRFDWLQPIVVDKDGVIIMGHGRLEAAKQLELKEVPVLVADWLTENEVRAAREADNMSNDLSFFDMEKLNLNLEQIDWLDIDMTKFGFKLDDELYDDPFSVETEYPEMELKAFEYWDYLVFVFDNQHDWLNALSMFNVQKVDAGYDSTKKIGLGRVLRGQELIEKCGDTFTDFEQ